MGLDLTIISEDVKERLIEGPKECYHCGSNIPYTIHNLWWFCFVCGRYTGIQVEGRVRNSEHSCLPVWSSYIEDESVVNRCDFNFCPRESFFGIQTDYWESRNLLRKRNWGHTIEFAEEMAEKLKGKKKRTPSPSPTLENFTPTKQEDPEFERKFAAFEASLVRKREAKEKSVAKRRVR